MNESIVKTYDIEQERLESNRYNSIYNKFLKRIIDFIIAIVLAIVLAPLYVIISIAIVVESGFPIFYIAKRGGYNNKPFKIFKFRTMVKDADKIGGGTTALNDSRITKVGNFLRKTKLDEIPQLFNIINGSMSFIGPRPELLKYTDQYIGEEECILKVRPGITDYSSIEFINLDEIVGGENADEMYEMYVLERKNQLRIKYAKKVSPGIDIKLFIKTVSKVFEKAIKFIIRRD